MGETIVSRIMRVGLLASIFGSAFWLLPGCEAKKNQTSGGSAAGAALPEGLFLSAPPENPRSINEVKVDAAKPSEIIIRGRVGGRTEPFNANSAVFILVDKQLPVCGEEAKDDHCPTPWDYCCEPAEKILQNSATIQVVGSDGRPLSTSLNGVHGLAPMTEVIVKGQVAQRSDDGVLVVNARNIYVAPAIKRGD
jgi:hypothetical protein